MASVDPSPPEVSTAAGAQTKAQGNLRKYHLRIRNQVKPSEPCADHHPRSWCHGRQGLVTRNYISIYSILENLSVRI